MKISFVPVGQVAGVIPSLFPFLKESSDWSRGRVTVDDIVRFVLNGQMHLWAVHDGDTAYGHLITEIKQYPQCTMLVIQYWAGEENHMQYCEDKMYEILDKFVK